MITVLRLIVRSGIDRPASLKTNILRLDNEKNQTINKDTSKILSPQWRTVYCFLAQLFFLPLRLDRSYVILALWLCGFLSQFLNTERIVISLKLLRESQPCPMSMARHANDPAGWELSNACDVRSATIVTSDNVYKGTIQGNTGRKRPVRHLSPLRGWVEVTFRIIDQSLSKKIF